MFSLFGYCFEIWVVGFGLIRYAFGLVDVILLGVNESCALGCIS